MALKDKYKELLDLAARLPVRSMEVKEEAGKLHINGSTTYQLDKNLLWGKIKSYENWGNEVAADIRIEQTDILGVYTVQGGDTLSKIAKIFLGEAKRYTDIFNLNKDTLTNPDLIRVGQKLRIPNP